MLFELLSSWLLANLPRAHLTPIHSTFMSRIYTTIIRPNLEYAEVMWSPHKKKHVLKLERIQRTTIKMAPELEDLTYEEILKEMHLTTLKERRERGDLITIYKLMNNLEETDRKNIILRGKGEARNLRGHKKKLQSLEWTEGRCDNGKECTVNPL